MSIALRMKRLLGEASVQEGAHERNTEEALQALKVFREGLDTEGSAAKTLNKALKSGSSLRIADALEDLKRAREGGTVAIDAVTVAASRLLK